jgi:hypothetical protein
MKTENETAAAMFPMCHPNPATAPSLRVPVTLSNREKLRRLRAAEMCAWEAADRNAWQRMSSRSVAPQSCVA